MHRLILNKEEVLSDRVFYKECDLVEYENGQFTKDIYATSALNCKSVREKIKTNYLNVNEQNIRIDNLHNGTPKQDLNTTIVVNESDIRTTVEEVCEGIEYGTSNGSISPSNTYNISDSLVDVFTKLKSDGLVVLEHI